MVRMTVPVVDVFAGPGGLNEGFSSYAGGDVFSTAVSIEMDPVACQTLTLRAAVRRSLQVDGSLPPVYYSFMKDSRRDLRQLEDDERFAVHIKEARSEVHQHELSEASQLESDRLVRKALGQAFKDDEPWVLIGGPPCQAYSLVGRSRRKHDKKFASDHKHTLYREYLQIISKFRPHVFVMENVKGMLSSQHDGGGIFQAICRDLREPKKGLSYELRSFVVDREASGLSPSDFIIRAERFGVPQSRHRVILLGVRSDVAARALPTVLTPSQEVTIGDVIGDLPKIRSGVSPRRDDGWEAWLKASLTGRLHRDLGTVSRPPKVVQLPLGKPFIERYESKLRGPLGEWLRTNAGAGITQHESRHHMVEDLARYAFLAKLGQQGSRRRVNELPLDLLPRHGNALREDAPFSDRFRVQLRERPSSTITSHIAKDGHYYIHFDPAQTRSLTVREAARIQTFPDNYVFMGSRTEQYHQVGNAVPPYLARQLAGVVADVLGIRAD